MSKRLQYALSVPVLPSAPAPEAGRLVVYSKADGLYVRLADGTESGPLDQTPSNLVTTDTDQTITGAKTFGVDVTVFGGRLTLYDYENDTPAGAVTYVYPGSLSVYAPPATAVSGDQKVALSGTPTSWNGTASVEHAVSVFLEAPGGVPRVRSTVPIYENTNRVYSPNNPQPAPSNMVTTDGDYQEITGFKDFLGGASVRNFAASGDVTIGAPFGQPAGPVDARLNLQPRISNGSGMLSGIAEASLIARHDADGTNVRLLTTHPLYDPSGRVYSPGNPPPAPAAPSNMVTTDTEQTITGVKTFAVDVAVTGSRIGLYDTVPGDPDGASTRVYPGSLSLSAPAATAVSGDQSVSIGSSPTSWNGTASVEHDADVFFEAPGGAPRVRSTVPIYENTNRVYSAANPQPAPSNMLTTDTAQTITGSKTFERIDFDSPTDPGAYGSMSADSLMLGSGDATAGNPSRVVSIFANLSRWNTTTQTSEWAGTPTITAFPGLGGQGPFWRTDVPFYEAGNRVYSAANLPPAPSNMVTTDTAQTVSGAKTFAGVTSTYDSVLLKGVDQETDPSVGFESADGTRYGYLYLNNGNEFYLSRPLRTNGKVYANGYEVLTTSSPDVIKPNSNVTWTGSHTFTSSTASASNQIPSTYLTLTATRWDGTQSVSDGSALIGFTRVGTPGGERMLAVSGAALQASNGIYDGTSRVYSASNPPPSAAPTNMVTTDTTQVITGQKQLQRGDGGSALLLDTTTAATSTTTGVNSPAVEFVGRRWNGSASENQSAYLYLAGSATSPRLTVGPSVGFSATGVYDGTYRVYSAANPPPAPSNMVTTDTVQEITAAKVFKGPTNNAMLHLDLSALPTSDGQVFRSPVISGQIARQAAGTTSTTRAYFYATIDSDGTRPRWETSEALVGVAGLYDGTNRVYSAGNKVPASGLSATGTASSTTFLRGDNTWATPAAPSNMVTTDTSQSITGTKTFPSTGIRLTAPNGTLYNLTVDNAGRLATTAV